ncbi:hypothetical protein QE152_g7960 [Popillia japonica]|uniref:Uncharacterized protein n=1 Tax=Popillia japonica TaxID=7064 RepID=A0AAW1MDJ1_POPJA
MVKESVKTKREIKATTRELGNIVGDLNRNMNIAKAHYLMLTDKVNGIEMYISHGNAQVQGSLRQRKQLNVGIQADETDIVREIAQRKKDINKEIQDASDVNAGCEGLRPILDHH